MRSNSNESLSKSPSQNSSHFPILRNASKAGSTFQIRSNSTINNYETEKEGAPSRFASRNLSTL